MQLVWFFFFTLLSLLLLLLLLVVSDFYIHVSVCVIRDFMSVFWFLFVPFDPLLQSCVCCFTQLVFSACVCCTCGHGDVRPTKVRRVCYPYKSFV